MYTYQEQQESLTHLKMEHDNQLEYTRVANSAFLIILAFCLLVTLFLVFKLINFISYKIWGMNKRVVAIEDLSLHEVRQILREKQEDMKQIEDSQQDTDPVIVEESKVDEAQFETPNRVGTEIKIQVTPPKDRDLDQPDIQEHPDRMASRKIRLYSEDGSTKTSNNLGSIMEVSKEEEVDHPFPIKGKKTKQQSIGFCSVFFTLIFLLVFLTGVFTYLAYQQPENNHKLINQYLDEYVRPNEHVFIQIRDYFR